jgi:hypothetical protein
MAANNSSGNPSTKVFGGLQLAQAPNTPILNLIAETLGSLQHVVRKNPIRA